MSDLVADPTALIVYFDIEGAAARRPRVGCRPLLRFVQLSSEWARQTVRQDWSFAKKQEFPAALLVVVPSESSLRPLATPASVPGAAVGFLAAYHPLCEGCAATARGGCRAASPLGETVTRRSMPTTREPLVWAASLSVCVAGWLIAHTIAYRLIASGEGSGALVERTGHGHLAFSPYVIAVSATVLLLALGGAVVAGATRRTRPAVPVAPFVLLPLLDLGCHTVLEALQHGGGVSASAALEPVFLVGLALQVPFALAALLLARAALAQAEGLGRGLTPRLGVRALALALPAPPRLLIGTEHRPIIPALSSGCAERAPPDFALVR